MQIFEVCWRPPFAKPNTCTVVILHACTVIIYMHVLSGTCHNSDSRSPFNTLTAAFDERFRDCTLQERSEKVAGVWERQLPSGRSGRASPIHYSARFGKPQASQLSEIFLKIKCITKSAQNSKCFYASDFPDAKQQIITRAQGTCQTKSVAAALHLCAAPPLR